MVIEKVKGLGYFVPNSPQLTRDVTCSSVILLERKSMRKKCQMNTLRRDVSQSVAAIEICSSK